MAATVPQPPYIYDTQSDAETASNQLYLSVNPEGTTERLWGWYINADGKYQLAAPDPESVIIPASPDQNLDPTT